jgi:hypothetical protein
LISWLLLAAVAVVQQTAVVAAQVVIDQPLHQLVAGVLLPLRWHSPLLQITQ